jgi:hypothetical protein
MTRTDVLALSRPQAAGAAPMRRRSSRTSRRLVVLPVTLLLAVALLAPTTALAATGESGYGTAPPKPSTGTSPAKEKSTPKPSTGTSPAKESTAPAKTSSAPTKESAKASTLPFTGFDLRWTIGAGVLLIAAGLSIVTVQRRQRRDTGG